MATDKETTETPVVPLNLGPGFQGADAPRDEDLYRCVHCGFCLPVCPTYVETGLETESPRGRIALMKAVQEGRLGINERVVSHWDLCLQCRACEVVCPSGVPFGRLMEYTRAQVLQHRKESTRTRIAKALFLRGLLPHLGRLRAIAWLLRVYQRWGLQTLVRRSRLLKLLPGRLAELESQQPQLSSRFFGPSPKVLPAYGTAQRRVILLSGCVMPLVQGPTMEAAVNVLRHNGCDVVVPVGQGCCGALNLHSGDTEFARRMARRNIDVFLAAKPDAIITASAGCGSTMKEYGELFRDDPAYREKAERFSALNQDITEFLASLPLNPPKGEVRKRVTYQDACHLAHAQRITEAPRKLLRAVPGLELVEMENSSRCCGAAGTYTLTQREMSRQVLESKMGWVAATGADIVVTANPGCTIQLEIGLRMAGIEGRVCHVVDILDEAYREGETN